MRFTSIPTRPDDHVSNDELVQDIILLLKDVVAFESTIAQTFHSNGNGSSINSNKRQAEASANQLTQNEFASLSLVIEKITDLNQKIDKRGIDLREVLRETGKQVNIDLVQLLNDSLRFPNIIPYARNLKGLRRLFLCYCGERETQDNSGLGLCIECIDEALDCVIEKKRDSRFILYSTYSSQVRCRHADFSTLLITFNRPGIWLPAWCEICLKQEKQRLAQ